MSIARSFVLLSSLWFATEVVADDPWADWRNRYQDAIYPILDQACSECHRGADAHGFDLEKFGAAETLQDHTAVWDEVGKRIRLNEMPPEGSPGLNDSQKSLLHGWLDARPKEDRCAELANEETQSWYRGVVMSRRLTKTEYLNAVNELAGVPIDPSLQIPSDGSGGEGFDTNGDTLFTSALHVEQYLAVADQVINDSLMASTTTSPAIASSDRNALGLASELLQTVRTESEIHTAVAKFARRAWRRPVQVEEVERLVALAKAARLPGVSAQHAAAEAFKAVLVSPYFLFVVETESEAGGVQALTSHELAMRLALFLWSSIPDESLSAAADRDALQTDAQIVEQTRRMIADERSRALGENFGLQWLGLTQFQRDSKPDEDLFPEYNDALASDLREEAIRTVWGIFRDDRRVLELIDADFIHANATLASYYSLDKTSLDDGDPNWQRLPLSDRQRGGVITLGAVLTSASYASRTSPVLRGRWVLEQVLGGKVPPPPEDVPALEEADVDHTGSLRERLEQHRKDPACAACHNRMDPLGFGLENFDATGRFRIEDKGQPIDATGKLPSGESFSGPEELKQTLLSRSGEFKTHFIRKLMGFALGRELTRFDDCILEDSLKALDANDQRANLILETIVTSHAFRHRFFKLSAQP